MQQNVLLLDRLDGDSLRHIRFYPWLVMLFMGLFLTANLVAQKVVPVGPLLFNAGDLVFPFMYLLSLVVTEVYGYAMSRRMIWGALISNLVVVLLVYGSIRLPAAECWSYQEAYQDILGRTPRILVASLFSFLIGEFLSTYVFAKVKVRCDGRYLWFRAICATITGQLLDSYLFTTIAFVRVVGIYEIHLMSLGAWLAKLFCQLICTPLVYRLANFLKRWEGIDVFDRETNFSPFNIG